MKCLRPASYLRMLGASSKAVANHYPFASVAECIAPVSGRLEEDMQAFCRPGGR
jgi:hypothetical protein